MTLANKIGISSLIIGIIGLVISYLSINPSEDKTTNYNSPNNINSKKVEINYITNNSNVKPKIEWKTYDNLRFGFSIQYPSHWEEGAETDNGDGKILYMGDPDIDIRVYAGQAEFSSSCFENIDNKKITYQLIELSTDKKELFKIYKNGNKIQCCMYIENSKIGYHFWIDVTKEFFDKNKLILIKIAKSFKFVNELP